MKRALPLIAILAGACQGAVGTVDLEIVTAPGSTVMDPVERLRLTLTNPETVIEAERTGGGFDLGLEVTAKGQNGLVYLEGFDADGNLVASGRTGPLPIAAFDATVRIFVAPPVSVEEAPEMLSVARSEAGATRLSFGVLLAGGRDGDGAVDDTVEIYNLYDHRVQQGEPLPEARTGISAMTGSFGLVWLFGGEDGAGTATHHLLLFDTNVAPAGAYAMAASHSELARSFATAAPIEEDVFVVLGDPVTLVDGTTGNADALDATLPADATAVSVLSGGLPNTLVVGTGTGASGAATIVNRVVTEVPAPAVIDRVGHGAVILPDGDALVIGGRTAGGLEADGVRFDFASREFTVIADLLATPREDAAIASTSEYIVVAGGTDVDGAVVTDIEIFDAASLARVATVPAVVPRTGASALRMANGQIVISGGLDASGAPTPVLELFTP